jgi:hypothetical protein
MHLKNFFNHGTILSDTKLCTHRIHGNKQSVIFQQFRLFLGFLFQNIDKKLSIGEKQTIDPLPSYGCLFGLRGYVRTLTQRDTPRFKKRRLAARGLLPWPPHSKDRQKLSINER